MAAVDRHRVPGPLGWYPAFRLHDLPNCVVSIRPRVATVTLNGADVSQVDDETGLGHHVVQATASKQPLWVASGGPNNKSYVEFDGVDEILKAVFTTAQPVHRFLVLLPAVAFVAYDQACDGGDGGVYSTSTLYYHPTGAKIVAFNQAIPGDNGTNKSIETASTLTAWQKIDVLWAGASSKLRVNGAAPVTGTLNTNDVGGLALGGRADAGGWYYGDPRVAEAVDFSAEVTGNALTLANWYLATEYSL